MNMSNVREAWTAFNLEHRCSIDRMLCTPKLRCLFLEAARNKLGSYSEEVLLWSLIGLRKRKALLSKP